MNNEISHNSLDTPARRDPAFLSVLGYGGRPARMVVRTNMDLGINEWIHGMSLWRSRKWEGSVRFRYRVEWDVIVRFRLDL